MHRVADVLGVRAALRRALVAGLAIAMSLVPLAAAPAVAVPAPERADPPATPASHLPPPPGTTRLESRKVGGGPGSGASAEASISRDGRWLAFASAAADLVAGDTNGAVDVFLRDRRTGVTRRLPLPGGAFVPAGGRASEASISGDGRYVAFTYQPPSGFAVTGSVVLVWDRTSGETVIGSKKSNGAAAATSSQPSLSRDGRFLAFTSRAKDVVPGDTNETADVFRIAWRGSTRPVLVSVAQFGPGSAPGTSDSPSISGDGSVIAFRSDAGDGIVDADTGSGTQVYARDITARRTDWLTPDRTGNAPDGIADAPSISADGRLVAFESSATDLVAGDTNGTQDVFVRDRVAGTTTLVSVGLSGAPATGPSGQAAISADGRVVVFASIAGDLVTASSGGIELAALAPGRSEVYARDVIAGETIRISEARTGGPAGLQNIGPVVSANGRYVGWASSSALLTTDPDNKLLDVFVRDLPPVALVLPPALEFGAQALTVAADPGAATVSNGGWSPLTVSELAITGSGRGDYDILADTCTGATLRREQVCTITIGFRPSRQGNRVGRLEISHNASGSPGRVTLRGAGSQATLTLDPGIGSPGMVTIAEGHGFPAGARIRLSWEPGITPKMPDIVADASGSFRAQVLVFHHDLLGERKLVATRVGGPAFPRVDATLLVVPGQGQPPTFALLRLLRLLPAVIVFRR
jgi:Tol biopolymer transport system component